MSQQVIDEIIAAFADVPRPTTLKDSWNSTPIEEISLYNVNPDEYQYFLPILLTCCLSSPPDVDGNLTREALRVLMPNYWYLMYEAHDERFDHQNSKLTELQCHAVCSFLGTILQMESQDSFYWQYQSAQCLKWGWNVSEHPAVIKMREFYNSMHHFQYPLATSPKNQALIEQITSGFANTPPPGDILNREIFRKGDKEGPDCVLEFQGLDWRTLHPRFVDSHNNGYSFLSDEEFRYFLPAFLIVEVWQTDEYENEREPISTVISNNACATILTSGLTEPVSHETIEAYKQYRRTNSWPAALELKSEDEKAEWCRNIYWYQMQMERFSMFNSTERKAIIAFLRFVVTDVIEDDSHRESVEIISAIENYWSKTV